MAAASHRQATIGCPRDPSVERRQSTDNRRPPHGNCNGGVDGLSPKETPHSLRKADSSGSYFTWIAMSSKRGTRSRNDGRSDGFGAQQSCIRVT